MRGGKLNEDLSPHPACRPGYLGGDREVRAVRLQTHAGCRRRRDAVLGTYPNNATARHIIGQLPPPSSQNKKPRLDRSFLFSNELRKYLKYFYIFLITFSHKRYNSYSLSFWPSQYPNWRRTSI